MNDFQKKRTIKFVKFLIIKVPIILGIIALLMIASLKLVERYPDPLREGFQDYLSGAYNTNATIGKLDRIAFFPMIDVQATDITMHNKSNAAIIDMELKSLSIRSPFWSMLLHANRINKLSIKGLKASSGIILPQSIQIDNLDIIDQEGPEQYGSFIVAEGLYNGQKMIFEAEIQKLKSSYKIGKEIPFSLNIGNVELSALFYKRHNILKIKNTILSFGGESSNAQDYILFDNKKINEDNPLHCLAHSDNIDECKIYLTQ
jgi:hypothetical protein